MKFQVVVMLTLFIFLTLISASMERSSQRSYSRTRFKTYTKPTTTSTMQPPMMTLSSLSTSEASTAHAILTTSSADVTTETSTGENAPIIRNSSNILPGVPA